MRFSPPSHKVALVHDYLFEQGGAENVFAVMAGMFPDAPIYTAIYNPDTVAPIFREREVHTSVLQRVTTHKRTAKALLPLYPAAFARMKVRGYDLVLSSSSSFAKGIDVGDARHVCYCHTPPRFLWQTDRYIEQVRGRTRRGAIHLATGPLRTRDRRDADNVDAFIANSHVTQERIRRIYGRDAAVVNPPIDVKEFHGGAVIEEYYLVVSRLLPYKPGSVKSRCRGG
ncbi:MAG: glycosyltransferase [Chloroflexota bacterium]|nr:glycosyltransferase [Chloroflexota bacterium]